MSTVDLAKITNALAWVGSRAKIETSLRAVLGTLPERKEEPQVKTADEFDGPGYTRKRINYFVDEWTRISAWLFVPDGRDEAPGILCCHRAVRQGKDEPAGVEGDPNLAFARHYAELGYVTLAPDCITAGDRVSSRLQAYDSSLFYKDHPKMSLLGKMLTDHMRAIDAFGEVGKVDTARIGVVGHGLGATNALLLAALDDRILACVASCGFSRFEKDKEAGRWARDEGMVLWPGMRTHIKEGEFPFDWEHVLALAAPSAIMVMTALDEAEGSNPQSCQQAVKRAAKVYELLGAGGAIDHHTHGGGAPMAPDGLEVSDDWFERWL